MMGAEQQRFKVGDRVRLKEKYGSWDAGTEGVIDSVLDDYNDEDDLIYTDTVSGAFGRRFELMPAWQPKVGDRVVWREPFASPFYTKGKAYEIKSSRNGYLFLTDDNRNAESGNHQWGVGEISSHFDLVAPLTIEAGKFYKTRDGRKVGPMLTWPRWDGDSHYDDRLCEKMGDGRYWMLDGKGTCAQDLIAEWVDEPAVAVAASNDNAAPAKFKVGDVVKFRDDYGSSARGRKATVVNVSTWGIQVDLGERGGVSTESPSDLVLLSTTPTPTAIVALIEDGVAKPATRPVVHASQEAATTEASRLALLHPGQEFGVFVLAGSKIADVVEEVVKKTVLRAA